MSVNDRIATQIKRFTKVTPSNQVGSGVFSYSGGNPILRFSIAEQDAYLLSKDLKFQFNFKCYRDLARTIPIKRADDIRLDSKIGVQSIIQNITISSRRYATSICEQIHNYNQLCSVAHPALSSTRDLSTQRSHEQISFGKGILSRSELNQTEDNRVASQTNGVLLQGRSFTSNGAAATYNGVDCSIQIYAGMLLQNLDLRLLGGLEFEIELASDVNVFSNSTTTANYTIDSCILNAPLLYKSANEMAQGVSPSSFSFLSYTSLYNVCQSTNATITNKVGLRGCLSMIQKFVPTNYINNPAALARAFASFCPGVKRLVYHRNGQRYPLEYGIKTDRSDGNPVASNIVDAKAPQVLLNTLSAFENYKDVKHSHITSQNLAEIQDNYWFLGVSFDQISGQGIDLSGGTISTELESTLELPSGAYPATPFGVYTFFLNKNTLVISPNQRIQSIE